MADWDDFEKIDDDWSNFEKIETHQKQGYQGVDTSDIWNNPNLTKEQKAQAIHERFQAENKRLDRENKWELSKLYGGAALEIGSALIPIGGGARLATLAGKALKDVGLRSGLPRLAVTGVRNLIKGAPGALGSGAVYGAGDNLMTGKSGAEAAQNIGANAATSLGISKALQAVPAVGKAMANKTIKNIESPQFQNAIGDSIELLTSVPQKYTKVALDNELSGNSIFNGAFDKETAYRPIENMLRTAKGMLPTTTDFGNERFNLGQKALQGMENLKDQAGAKVGDELEKLNNREVQNGGINGIKGAINTVINSYGNGGIYNSAKSQAKNVVNFLDENINKEGLTLRDLHRIKDDLYNMGYSEAGNRNGRGAEVARKTAEQVNNYLRGVSPEYARANDLYSLILDATKGLEGETTMGSRLGALGSKASAESGMTGRLKNIDDLLPQKDKFYKKAFELLESESEIDNINKIIGRQFERNPRLLNNRTDEAFADAFQDLQKRTGMDIQTPLDRITAREKFENLFPGQGGGFGSNQGAGNLTRGALLAAALRGILKKDLRPAAAALMLSPKVGGRGIVQGIGDTYKRAQNAYDMFFYMPELKRYTPVGLNLFDYLQDRN